MQIIARVGPFRVGPAHTLLCVCHVRPRLINSRCPSGYVSLRALDIRLRNGNAAYQCCNLPAFVSDLPFEGSLLGKGVFESVLIWAVINLKEQFALLNKLIVVDVQANDRTFYLRRNSNEIGGNFRVVRSRLAIDFEERNQTKSDCGRYDAYPQVADSLAVVLRLFRFHKTSSVEKNEPQSKCEQGCQAGIHYDWRREHFFEMQLRQ